jgi:hypothetical protein
MSEAATAPTLFCPGCGRKLTGDEKFCRTCGKSLAEEGVPPSAPQPPAALGPSSEENKTDPLLAVRVVLLIGAGISAFTAPAFITLILIVAWLVVMFLPKKKTVSSTGN